MTTPLHWQPEREGLAGKAWPAVTASWLKETGSITARLKRQWPNVTVQVLDEGLRQPLAAERQRLALREGVPGWVREVVLHAGERPLIRARTIVPAWTADNPWHVLSTLGERPLGELLFNLPDLERSPLEFAWGLGASAPARRRVYTWSGAPLLLTETFVFLACTAPITSAADA